jgi:multisubunit Na+/H+ antiporter MnhE subunit
MMRQYALIALPGALLWVILTNQIGIISFLIGYLISLLMVMVLGRSRELPLVVDPAKLPGQLLALVIYSVVLARDIFLSGIDVTLRIIGVRPLRPGIIAVPTQDETHDPIIGGLSAHGITITPGELVVDFSRDGEIMYVHCLDVEWVEDQLDDEQAERLRMIRRILGHD